MSSARHEQGSRPSRTCAHIGKGQPRIRNGLPPWRDCRLASPGPDCRAASRPRWRCRARKRRRRTRPSSPRFRWCEGQQGLMGHEVDGSSSGLIVSFKPASRAAGRGTPSRASVGTACCAGCCAARCARHFFASSASFPGQPEPRPSRRGRLSHDPTTAFSCRICAALPAVSYRCPACLVSFPA